MNGLLVFLLWFILLDNSLVIIKPKIDKDNYIAAIYSMQIDFSKDQQIIPEIQYAIPGLSTILYKYFIQYGKDTIIEIIDPGNEIKSFTACIRKLDYSKRESTFTCFIDRAKNYYTTKDSIPNSIEVSKGSVTDLCKGVELNSRCDSVSFTSYSSKTDYTVILSDTTANLRSDGLFYPDIQYLPFKIIGIGPSKNTLTLEEVIYGKSSIDSLLQLYSYEGYARVTDEEIGADYRQKVLELIEKVKCNE